LLEKGFNTVALKIFTSVKSSTFSTLCICGDKGEIYNTICRPCWTLCFFVQSPCIPCHGAQLHVDPSMSLAVALLMMFMSDVLSQIEANCPVVHDTSNAEGSQPMSHFLPSCRDAKWLCRCKQHDVFAANTYQVFVRFPS